MRVIDPGHVYDLAWLDGDPQPIGPYTEEQPESLLTFVKREGKGYLGNVGRHPGTNIQEVLRVLIHRVIYLNRQIPDGRNKSILYCLRMALWLLELRAANRHGRLLEIQTSIPPIVVVGGDPTDGFWTIEALPTCRACGHIGCEGTCHPTS